MKIYVSGRIKDYPEYLQHFDDGCQLITQHGHDAINPCDLGQEGFTYEEYMKADIAALVTCDAILMLEGWETSSGARCEHLVAAMCGLGIYYEKTASRYLSQVTLF